MGYSSRCYYQANDLLEDPILGDDISVGGESPFEEEDFLITTKESRSIFSTEDAIAVQCSQSSSSSSSSSSSTTSDENDTTTGNNEPPSSSKAPQHETTNHFSASAQRKIDTLSWGDWDVPLGRAQEVREFVGNVRFRGIVEQHRPAYSKAIRKSEKTAISIAVHNIITYNGGRFLDKDKKRSGSWFEIPQEKALAKISQTLRNGTRPVRRFMTPTSATETREINGLVSVSKPLSPSLRGDDDDFAFTLETLLDLNDEEENEILSFIDWI